MPSVPTRDFTSVAVSAHMRGQDAHAIKYIVLHVGSILRMKSQKKT